MHAITHCPLRLLPRFAAQPDSGRITAYRSPGGHGIRLDGSMASGNVVSRHYDSLVS